MNYTVLHFPHNTASLASENNKALQALGVKSKAYVIKLYKDTPIVSNDGVHILPFNHLASSTGFMPTNTPLFPLASFAATVAPQGITSLKTRLVVIRAWGIEFLKRALAVLPFHRGVQRALACSGKRRVARKLAFLDDVDIIHCYVGELTGSAVETAIRERHIPGLAAWQGSEIRRPSVEFETNPYYHLLLDADGSSPYGDDERSRLRQQYMYDLGFEPLVTAGMRQYILPGYVGPIHQIFHPVSLEAEPAYPDVAQQRPLIVHAPSKQKAKGSAYVQRAIDQLRPTAEFDYREVTGMPRSEALALMRRCDIYIDQLIVGDHGMAALEAMSYGKPTVCYLKPSVLELLPKDIPIVNATVDDLAEVLLGLIQDPQRRHDSGVASRAYVERYHDPLKTAARLDEIYQDVLERHGGLR